MDIILTLTIESRIAVINFIMGNLIVLSHLLESLDGSKLGKLAEISVSSDEIGWCTSD